MGKEWRQSPNLSLLPNNFPLEGTSSDPPEAPGRSCGHTGGCGASAAPPSTAGLPHQPQVKRLIPPEGIKAHTSTILEIWDPDWPAMGGSTVTASSNQAINWLCVPCEPHPARGQHRVPMSHRPAQPPLCL